MRMQKYIRQIGVNNDFSDEEASESEDDANSEEQYNAMGVD